jgi:putative ABC transport system permease protein
MRGFALREAVVMGLDALRSYKLRAGLTILGVVMGIMTVTGMSAIVAGLNSNMASQIDALGSGVVFVRPFSPGQRLSDEEFRRRKGLTATEVEALAHKVTAARAVAPMEPLIAEVIKYGNQKAEDAFLFGTTPAYETVHDTFVEKGRFITDIDVGRAARVAVLGADVTDALFPFVDPIDKEILIDGRQFRVVGVLERKGKFLFRSRDNLVVVPLGSVSKKDPRFPFMVADVKAISAGQLDDTVEQVREVLRRERKLRYSQSDNFGVFTQDTLTDLYRQITGGIYMVMIAISSIGLLVGGVGVMNIMLVSVTERTREIGIRKALGARRSDIRWQFLTEAMTLTGVGGVLGIVLGGGIAWLVNTFSPFPAVVQPLWIALAFGTAVGVGLTFGLWPAIKAAKLDPIEALRYE